MPLLLLLLLRMMMLLNVGRTRVDIHRLVFSVLLLVSLDVS